MNKVLLAALFTVSVSVVLGSNQEAYATTYSLSDQASCEAAPFFGVWDGSGVPDLCSIHSDATINAGDAWFLDTSNIVLVSFGTFTNDGSIRINAIQTAFSNGGILNNNGDITACGGSFATSSILNNYGQIRRPSATSCAPISNAGTLFIAGTTNNFGSIILDGGSRLTTGGTVNNYAIIRSSHPFDVWINGANLYNFFGGVIIYNGDFSPNNNVIMAGGTIGGSGEINAGVISSIFCDSGTILQNDRCVPDGSPSLICGPNTFESGGQCLPVSSLAFCGEKTIQVGGFCVPNILAICAEGTTADENVFMCFAQTMGQMVGGMLLEIDNYALFVAAIGTNPVITGLVGITIAGVAGQAVWYIYKKKNSDKS